MTVAEVEQNLRALAENIRSNLHAGDGETQLAVRGAVVELLIGEADRLKQTIDRTHDIETGWAESLFGKIRDHEVVLSDGTDNTVGQREGKHGQFLPALARNLVTIAVGTFSIHSIATVEVDQAIKPKNREGEGPIELPGIGIERRQVWKSTRDEGAATVFLSASAIGATMMGFSVAHFALPVKAAAAAVAGLGSAVGSVALGLSIIPACYCVANIYWAQKAKTNLNNVDREDRQEAVATIMHHRRKALVSGMTSLLLGTGGLMILSTSVAKPILAAIAALSVAMPFFGFVIAGAVVGMALGLSARLIYNSYKNSKAPDDEGFGRVWPSKPQNLWGGDDQHQSHVEDPLYLTP